ncbi:MAG: tetratricopeptide repeat protein [Chthonomonadaceae bacterium]|nr:tetratricopeptide repeat protein [Chthonomonadaceae bacterium]
MKEAEPTQSEPLSDALTHSDADTLLQDTENRRKWEGELIARGMTPMEVQRLLGASSRTYDSELLPLSDPSSGLTSNSLPNLPSLPKSASPVLKGKAKSASVEAEMMQLARQLREKKAEVQRVAIVSASKDFPEFRASSLQEKIAAEPLLRDANIARKRNDYREAEEKCRTALSLTPKDPAALELLGDILQGVGRVDEAMAAYQRAVEADAKRVSAERKYGELITQQQNFESYDPEAVPRNPFVATLLSALIPGAGQFYNGDTVKGAFFLAMTGLFAYLLRAFIPSTPAKSAALGHAAKVVANSAKHAATNPFSGNSVIVIVFALTTYIVCMTDAMLTAKKRNSG